MAEQINVSLRLNVSLRPPSRWLGFQLESVWSMKYSVLVCLGMWKFQNNSHSWRAGGRRSGPLWTLQLNIRHYPPLQGVSSRCPLQSVCCRITFCMPLCINIPAKTLPRCFFVDIWRSQHQHWLIQQDHLQQKKVMPMLHHTPCIARPQQQWSVIRFTFSILITKNFTHIFNFITNSSWTQSSPL